MCSETHFPATTSPGVRPLCPVARAVNYIPHCSLSVLPESEQFKMGCPGPEAKDRNLVRSSLAQSIRWQVDPQPAFRAVTDPPWVSGMS